MASDNDQPKEKTFQVVDKRRFAADGQERTADTGPITKTVDSGASLSGDSTSSASYERPASASTQQFTVQDSPPPHEEAESVSFTSFVMSLATQVLMQIGEMAAPNGIEIPVDLEAASQTIDIMAMLQRRTRGNLSQEESRFMEEVLHSLRVSFIAAKKKTS